jgi:Ser/Thr protein kinase RdoA (MazF antagonist)
MEAIGRAGLLVPAPIRSRTGAVLHRVHDVQVDVLTWMTGTPLGETGTPLETANPTDVFSKIGQALARLHTASDAWTPPPAFTRCAWDRTGLLGETPLWGRFWDNPTLSGDDRVLFRQVWQVADRELAARESRLDYGLIHADLVRENILVDGDRLQLIDFDDGGYGFRLFDVATALIKNLNEPDYPALQDALIAGYLDLRPLDVEALDLFLLLRAATYVGWIMPRMDESGADVRNTRLVDTTRHLAQRYLARV